MTTNRPTPGGTLSVIQRRPERPRTTQAEVARLANVSQAVVSYVLNGSRSSSVSPETRRRVLDAIEELGYVPDAPARTLRTRRTLTIATIIPDITNPFYPAFERGIQDVAEARGYDLITYNSDGLYDKELKCIRSILRGHVDGLILVPFQVTMADLQPLVSRGVPVVIFGDMAHETLPIPYDRLYVDNVTASRDLVTFLIDRGHRRIGMIAGPADVPRRESRVRGYRDALAARGIPSEEVLIRVGDFTEEGGYRATRELLKLSPMPTALFAANDMIALGALFALHEAGLRVPDDLAIVGFDDIPAAKLLHPPLTTVAQFPERIGRRAAEMFFDRLGNDPPTEPRCEVMPVELKIRASA
jgi:LacI family transcriptional regulator